nr:uncharacterized mitochondrial protein AtMg00810-like [Tanacetum cinerariifolium]
QALSQFSQAPRTTHLKDLVKVLRYIKNRPGQGLHFPKDNSLQLKAVCDSDWANCNFTRRDKIRAGQVLPKYVPTKDQAADVLAKGLSKAPH